MTVSPHHADLILQAMDSLQMEDRLSREQWETALQLMDFYPRLNKKYAYLRDRYAESCSRRDDTPG
jgi:hypothetical protein